MKTKNLLFIIFIAIIFVLTACPYKSKVPIDVPNQEINKELIGKWIKKADKSNDNPEYFMISKRSDKFKCDIVKFEYQSSDSTYKKTKYITHFTTIKNKLFLNMQKEDEDDFYLHRLDLSGDEFVLYELTENIDEQFTSSKALKKFIKKNMKHSFFYNKDEKKYIKVNK